MRGVVRPDGHAGGARRFFPGLRTEKEAEIAEPIIIYLKKYYIL
jgi:hypothetical protein